LNIGREKALKLLGKFEGNENKVKMFIEEKRKLNKEESEYKGGVYSE
jgi:hypothetical protein